MEIKVDFDELERLEEKMSKMPKETMRGMSYAINRTLSKAVTFISDEVKQEYPSVIRKDIKSRSHIKKSKPDLLKLAGSIDIKGTRMRASYFPHQISRSKNRSPVTLKIKRQAKTSAPNPVMFGEGVGGTRGAKGREVFKRKLGTEIVKPVYTLSIPQMVSNEEVWKDISVKLSKHFMERFEHELDYRLGYLDKR